MSNNTAPPVAATFIGFLMGFITTPILVFLYADMQVANIRVAEAVCEAANSRLVSLDHFTATCENRAEIPYARKK